MPTQTPNNRPPTLIKIVTKEISKFNLLKNYRLLRWLQHLFRRPKRIKLTYQTQDFHIQNGDVKVPIRVYNGKKKWDDCPIIIFLHGGGWVAEDVNTYEATCEVLAKQTRAIIISVDYRLAPEHPFPAAFNDCYGALQETIKWSKIMFANTSTKREIIVMGDSAGANLAAATSLCSRDKHGFMPDKQILLYPVCNNNFSETSPYKSVQENGTDYILTSKFLTEYFSMYCPNPKDQNNPYAAPLLAKNFSHQPDTLLITAQFDPLRDEGEDYGQKLAAAGNKVTLRRMENAVHGFISFPKWRPEVKEAYKIINEFIDPKNN